MLRSNLPQGDDDASLEVGNELSQSLEPVQPSSATSPEPSKLEAEPMGTKQQAQETANSLASPARLTPILKRRRSVPSDCSSSSSALALKRVRFQLEDGTGADDDSSSSSSSSSASTPSSSSSSLLQSSSSSSVPSSILSRVVPVNLFPTENATDLTGLPTASASALSVLSQPSSHSTQASRRPRTRKARSRQPTALARLSRLTHPNGPIQPWWLDGDEKESKDGLASSSAAAPFHLPSSPSSSLPLSNLDCFTVPSLTISLDSSSTNSSASSPSTPTTPSPPSTPSSSSSFSSFSSSSSSICSLPSPRTPPRHASSSSRSSGYFLPPPAPRARRGPRLPARDLDHLRTVLMDHPEFAFTPNPIRQHWPRSSSPAPVARYVDRSIHDFFSTPTTSSSSFVSTPSVPSNFSTTSSVSVASPSPSPSSLPRSRSARLLLAAQQQHHQLQQRRSSKGTPSRTALALLAPSAASSSASVSPPSSVQSPVAERDMDAFVFANVPEPPSLRKFGVVHLSEQLAAPSPSNRTSSPTLSTQLDELLLPSSAFEASSTPLSPSSSSSVAVASSAGEADEDDNQDDNEKSVEVKREESHQREGADSDDDNNAESKTPASQPKAKLFDEPDSDEHVLARSVSFKMTGVGKRTQWLNPEDLADMLG